MKSFFKKLFSWLWKYLKPFTNFKFALVFLFAWLLTNGIWYLFAFVPMNLPDWLIWFSRSYIAFLYLPWTPEKLITIPIAVFLQITLFKNDLKTKAQLDDMYKQAKDDWKKVKDKFKSMIRNIKLKIAISRQRRALKHKDK